MRKREKTELLIVHCSDSNPNVTVTDIRSWHIQRGWEDIGYHYVIYKDGSVHEGRPLEMIGAHCENDNHNSVGICLCGRENFPKEQLDALRKLLFQLMEVWLLTPDAIFGHRDRASGKAQGKTCPNFDVQQWWKGA